MPTKSYTDKQIQEQVLKLYLEGKSQKEINQKLSDKAPNKNLKKFIKESEYMSPKNFRVGSIALFLVNIVSTPLGIFLRGEQYYSLLPLLITISISFSLPFLIIGILLYRTKDLRNIMDLSLVMLLYLVFYVILFALLSYTTKILAMMIFPVILLPTFIGEYMKLRRFIKFVGSNGHKQNS